MEKKKVTGINTRYPADVLEAIRQFAREDQCSFNGEVIWILREYIAKRKGEKKQ